MFELAQYGGAFFVAGLALVIIYKLLDVYVFASTGNGNNKMERQLGYINANIKKVRNAVNDQTEMIRSKFDLMKDANTAHDLKFEVTSSKTTAKLDDVQKSIDECKGGIKDCHDEIIREAH